jgi:hypothetical protein
MSIAEESAVDTQATQLAASSSRARPTSLRSRAKTDAPPASIQHRLGYHLHDSYCPVLPTQGPSSSPSSIVSERHQLDQ